MPFAGDHRMRGSHDASFPFSSPQENGRSGDDRRMAVRPEGIALKRNGHAIVRLSPRWKGEVKFPPPCSLTQFFPGERERAAIHKARSTRSCVHLRRDSAVITYSKRRVR